MKPFKHTTPVEIRFSDIDALGHVNNAMYLSFMESARFRYFDEVIGENMNWQESGLIVARAELNFVLPVHMRDKVTVYTAITRVGNTSFDFSYRLVRAAKQGEEEVANGKTVLVCYNYKAGKPVPVPEAWIKKAEFFEGLKLR